MATIMQELGSPEYLKSLGADSGVLDRADPAFLASVNAHGLVSNVLHHRGHAPHDAHTERKPDPVLVQSHNELADLRGWVKKLLIILARKKDIDLEGAELDAYFVKWVKRQEDKRGGGGGGADKEMEAD